MKQRLATEREQLEQAIAAIEKQRKSLGDDVVDSAVDALREKLAALDASDHSVTEERKQVTILFADLVGFTLLSQKLDAERVHEILNIYFALWRDAIRRNGGVIEKYIGDAVMAVFGIPAARENDPEAAVLTALDVRQRLPELNERLGREYDICLSARVGINTGNVIACELGREGEFTVTGDAVNMAKRLEQACPSNEILISHMTFRHTRGVFDVLPQEPLLIKGRAEPVRTYVVRSALPHADRFRRRGIEGIETRLVGRESELLMLEEAFSGVLEHHRTYVVLVTGEAGIGKSRLLYEFEHHTALRGCSVNRFKGRVTPEVMNIPFGLIRDMFANTFTILETDEAKTVLAKFRAGMEGVLGVEQADVVGHLIGFDFSSSKAVENLLGSPNFASLARAYLTNYFRIVARRPTMLLLEDIHWADSSSVGLLHHLVTEISDAPLLVVCLARPMLSERFEHWGEEDASYVRLDLKPLPESAIEELVMEILQKAENVPDDLVNLIVGRSEGNPFYVEELIKMLMDDGVIERNQPRWSVRLDRLMESSVPPTLTGVLQARLDSLPQEEKEVLQRASVVGRQFWDSVVTELETVERVPDRQRVSRLLEAVTQRELVFKRERSAFAGTNEYAFKHVILRDVTYETVLLRVRRQCHGLVARWLEETAGARVGEYFGLIARHYELAGELENAAQYLRRSGRDLMQISAFPDARAVFERVLGMMREDDVTGRAIVLVKLGIACVETSDYSSASEYLEQGLKLATESGDSAMAVTALNWLGRAATEQGEHQEAERRHQDALARARGEKNLPGMALAMRYLGFTAFWRGETQRAEHYATEALVLSRELGDRQGIAAALNVLGNAVSSGGKHEEARQCYGESLSIFREIGDRRGEIGCLNNLGEIARAQGDGREAQRCYHESLTLCRDIGFRWGTALSLVNLGFLHAGLHEDDLGRDCLMKALEESQAIGAMPITLGALVGIVRLEANAGRYLSGVLLLGYVLANPALSMEVKEEEAKPLLELLQANLPKEQVNSALERGSRLELGAVLDRIQGMGARPDQ